MYFVSYLVDVLTMANFVHYPQSFNSSKLLILNRFSEAPRDDYEFESNLSYFSLCL